MDCCNYMPYRHPQPYYGYYNEALPQYHSDYYGHHQNMYQDYYRNMSPYYNPQHWQGDFFTAPDYVYNPKEARIRKAMRDAASRDRDRSIGASPMLARPSARRAPPPSHRWTPTPHDDLMMSPLTSTMRPGLDSPCYPPQGAGPGGGQFLASMGAPGASYAAAKLRQEAADAPQSDGYIQPNPLTQLHQQTEMWHNFQDEMRPRSSGNPFMMHQDHPSPYTSHQPSPPLSIPSPHMMDHQQHRHTPHPRHSLSAISMPMTPPHSNSNMSMTPPYSNMSNTPPLHSNENVPPDEWGLGVAEVHFAGEAEQPLAQNNVQQEGLLGLYGGERQVGEDEQRKQLEMQQLQQPQQQHDKTDGVRHAKKRAASAQPPTQPPQPPPVSAASSKRPPTKPLPDFNEAFGSTERGRFQSPPDPRLGPNKGGYLDLFYGDGCQPQPPVKFDDFQL